MPEVLRVIARLNLGGPARHVLRIHAPLAALGYRSTVVAGHTGPDEQDLTDELRAAGVQVLTLPSLGRNPRPLSDLRALADLRRLIRERKPDLVHTHTAKAGLLGRLAARWSRPAPAVVHTFHGHVLKGYYGPLVSAALARVEAALARSSDALVAVAGPVRDELLALGVGSAERFHLVPPGIDFERTRPDREAGAALRRQLGCSPQTVLVGLVGRLATVKRPLAALEAFDHARRQGLDGHLLVLGDGHLGAAVRAALAGRDDATWMAPRTQLGAVWGALDLCLLSSAAEGLPQVATESLAAGVPVLATAVGGLPELVRHGHDGWLVQAEALPEALAALLADRSRLAALTRAARDFQREPHLAQQVAAQLAAVYDQVLAARGRVLERSSPSGHAAAPCGS